MARPRQTVAVRASCPECGILDMRSNQFRVMRDEHPKGDGTYTFRCPRCQEIVTKRAPGRTLNLLTAADAVDYVWGSPLTETEVDEAVEMMISGRFEEELRKAIEE